MGSAVMVWNGSKGAWQEVARFFGQDSETIAEEKVREIKGLGKQAYSRNVYLTEVDAG